MKNTLNSTGNYFKKVIFMFSLLLILSISITPLKSLASVISFPNKIDTYQERLNVQKVLNMVMNPSPLLKIDGKLGKQSIRAVQIFQESKGLIADGIIGTKTRLALEFAQSTPTGCIPGALFNATTGQPCTVVQENNQPLVYSPNANLTTPPVYEPKADPVIPENKSTTTIPSVLVSFPTNNVTIGTNTFTLSFNASNATSCWYDLGGLRIENGTVGDTSDPLYQYQLPNCQSKTITLPNDNYVLNIWAKDASGTDALDSIWFRVLATTTDTTPPTITAFGIPSTSTNLTVPVSPFNATDNVAVTGHFLTETSTAPSPTASSWTTTTPTSYTFSSTGNKTLYAWTKDAAGNVSNSLNDSVTITISGDNLPASATKVWQTTDSTGDPDLTKPGRTYYIDSTYTGSTRNGSINQPYNSWEEVPKNNSDWAYLFKRGTTITLGNMNFTDKANLWFGAYGTGDRPKIIATTTGNVISAGFQTTAIQLTNYTRIAGLEISCQNTCDSTITAHHNTVIENNYLHDAGNPIRAVGDNGVINFVPQENATRNLTIRNNVIRNADTDGIFLRNIFGLILIEDNLIEKSNQVWYPGASNNAAPGDGIQFSCGTPNWKIINNRIDRSDTGNKFDLIICNDVRDSNFVYEISGNTFISPRSDGSGGAMLNYTGGNTDPYNYIVTNNYFKGDRGFNNRPGLSALRWLGSGLMSSSNVIKDAIVCVNNASNSPQPVAYSNGDSFSNCGYNTMGNVSVTNPIVLGVSTYHFTQKLELGSKGNEVKELQKILIAKGYLKGIPDGNFGKYTVWAVKAYQKANGLKVDGIVGQEMREVINK